MFKNFKPQFLTLIIIIFSLFLNTAPALAQTPNSQPGVKIEIKNLTAANQKVTGTLSLNNLASLYYPQLFYTIALNAPSTTRSTTFQGKTVSLQNPGGLVTSFKKPLELANKAQAEVNFEIPYTNSLPSGSYSVLASVQTSIS